MLLPPKQLIFEAYYKKRPLKPDQNFHAAGLLSLNLKKHFMR